MTTDILLFYFFSSFSIMSTIMVITLSNAVHAVLFLIIVFCNVSSLLLILGTEFFSFMFLIVYVGAIAVLFLFVVMMLNVKTNPIKINTFSILPVGLIISLIVYNQVVTILDARFTFIKNEIPLNYVAWVVENQYLTNAELVGTFLYTRFSLLFLLCSLILLVAMIGAIVLTMHQRPTVKKQYISSQLLRDPKGSIKFIYLRN